MMVSIKKIGTFATAFIFLKLVRSRACDLERAEMKQNPGSVTSSGTSQRSEEFGDWERRVRQRCKS